MPGAAPRKIPAIPIKGWNSPVRSPMKIAAIPSGMTIAPNIIALGKQAR
jgi:hypothetical protein